MFEQEILEKVGCSGASALATQTSWVHRRVERVSFPNADDIAVRRRISIDFSIPETLRAADEATELSLAVYYVPLSVLRKWPPVTNLDLRIPGNEPAPLLTRTQNAVADGSLLVEVAQQALGADIEIDRYLKAQLKRIPAARSAVAASILEQLFSPIDGDPTNDFDRQRKLLWGQQQFVHLAGGLTESTILWLRVSGKPKQRQIVKFAYDARVNAFEDLGIFRLPSFGWRPLNAQFEVPHFGDSGSFHLEATVPAPLEITDAKLEVRPRRQLGAEDEPEHHADVLKISAQPERRHAHYYLAGDRLRTEGAAQMAVMPRGGPIHVAWIAALLVAAMLWAYHSEISTVLANRGPALAPLLVVPGLLAYLVTRPGEHSAATRLLRGYRLLVVGVGLFPIAAAVILVLAPECPGEWLEHTMAGLALAALADAFLLLASAIGIGSKTPMTDATKRSIPTAALASEDPGPSMSEERYVALADSVEAARNVAKDLEDLQAKLAQAELTDEERDDLSQRITFYLSCLDPDVPESD